MNDILVQLWQQLGPQAGLSLTILALGVTFLVWTLYMRRQLACERRALKDLRQQMRALTSAALGMGERVMKMERRQKNLAERQEQMGSLENLYESANQSYEQAISLAQRGASVEDLVDSCGVSENEAQLIALMHRLDKAS